MFKDSDHFTQQLPGYRIKPLYIWAGVAAWKACSGSPLDAFRKIGIASFVAFAMFLFTWVARQTNERCAICTILPFTLVSAEYASLITPDTLSSIILACAVAAWVHAKTFWHPLVLSAVALLVRPDNILVVVIVPMWLGWRALRGAERRAAFCSSVGLGLAGMLVQRIGHAYPWTTYIHTTLFVGLVAPAQAHVYVGVREYLRTLWQEATRSDAPTVIALPLGMSALGLLVKPPAGDRGSSVIVALWLALSSHVLLLPTPEFRSSLGTCGALLALGMIRIWQTLGTDGQSNTQPRFS